MNDAAMTMLGVSFFITIGVTVKSIANVWMKRIEARRETMPLHVVDQRLERIEASIDVIAVEVERIAEAQRFAVRLATERAPGGLPAAGRNHDGRMVTPH
ncbi:MAG TPA: hypothetical protein VFK04_16735 [Gemmatimonadaceae bacterium]|jgi:hypothetical protein|nr:hypothetical protein [Gemmatimonadaceae bacterium]